MNTAEVLRRINAAAADMILAHRDELKLSASEALVQHFDQATIDSWDVPQCTIMILAVNGEFEKRLRAIVAKQRG